VTALGSSLVQTTLDSWATRFTAYFDGLLDRTEASVPELAEAVRYSALAPGKRVRPFLVASCCTLCGGREEDGLPAAAAIECVHAFSLIHDDLPAMDDDDLRRGRPTNHKVYGEAMAILAGDALVTLAFEILATRPAPLIDRVALVAELARAAGWQGMIGGQAADILGEKAEPSLDRVRRIHDAKTAALIAAACRMGAISARARPEQIDALGCYGRHLGRAFQIVDDMLDVTSTPQELGKATTKDADAGKQSYPRVVGLEASREAAEREVRLAVESLESFGPAADNLRGLAQFVLHRRN